MVIDIEVSAVKAENGKGNIKITGIVEEEEMEGRGHKLKRTSSARSSVENVITVLERIIGIKCRDYEIHINFPGGIPIDGPSAGIAMAAAIYSAITGMPISCDIAMTGEISIRGKVKPVGGVVAKVEAAKIAGIKRVLIPKENWQELFADIGIDVIPVEDISQVMEIVFSKKKDISQEMPVQQNQAVNVLSASGT